jgi:hypothetical protein
MGHVTPLEKARLVMLYGDARGYAAKLKTAVDRLVKERWLTAGDAQRVTAELTAAARTAFLERRRWSAKQLRLKWAHQEIAGSIVRQLDAIDHLAANRHVGHPPDREQIHDLVAQEHRDLRPGCEGAGKPQRRPLLLANKWA